MSIDGPTACPSLVPSRDEPEPKKAMEEDEEKATGRSESVEEVVWVHWIGDEYVEFTVHRFCGGTPWAIAARKLTLSFSLQ